MIKRDGKEVTFKPDKITRAIYKAMLSVKIGSMKDAELLTQKVVASLSNDFTKPTVEQIQDRVENILMGTEIDGRKFNDVAKSYILYRERRRTKLSTRTTVSLKWKKALWLLPVISLFFHMICNHILRL